MQRPRAKGGGGVDALPLWRPFLLFCCLVLSGCSETRTTDDAPRDVSPPPIDGKLFTRLPSTYTGVAFENRLTETRERNVFTYRNFYNGGGVALGDLVGDSLPDIVLTANESGPRLLVNLGEFRFRDVTKAAGLETGGDSWTTGVTLADVNGDGRLDIYLSRAGSVEPRRRANQLWISQGLQEDGVPRFKEMAAQYGVADEGYATHAAFVDYDRDDDLDLVLINNSPRAVSSFGSRNVRNVRHRYGGHKLYRNDLHLTAQGRVVGSWMSAPAQASTAARSASGWESRSAT
jgi:enediyne biosynthesis protein E4